MKNTDPKNPTTQKIFGTVINEDDASHLVGGIVEKGFSEQPLNGPTSWTFAPRPTVLPFPVPRHRSHGPHWAPKVGDVCGNNDHDDEENEEEEEDFTGINQIGNFAKPVQRKEKKGMDFCNWREIVASDNSSVPYKREERERKVNSTSKERNAVAEASQNKNNSNERPPDENGNGASLSVEDGTKSQDVIMEDEHLVQEKEEDMAMDIEQGGVEQSSHSVLPQQKCGNGITEQDEEIIEDMHPTLQVNAQKCSISANKADASFDSEEVEGRHNASNLESQIDAENRAQLAKMSADEIAEAQAELLAKLSPAVLEALKRKGQEKLKREKSYRSGSHLSGEKGSLLDRMKNETSQGTQKKNVEDDTPKLNASTSVWDEWSKRVESVRELRFSFDGNIVESELEVPKSGVSVAQDLSERDYLRTEGDPGAAGYTIKEAVALTRSAVAGQRTIALHLIASVLDRAICRIHQNQLGCILRSQDRDGFNDWEAIWAFILGPEPELALSLRMSLDDNHRSVVLACARAIQCALSFEINEDFFEIVERIPTLQRDAPTAPVFRSRPEIEDGFVHGGFWKYNTKPSNILPFARDSVENDESERTIQDDVVVAGQDIAAGLIRMGILQRVQYLLETEPSAALEECLISILIAIARHSPTCADAIMKCQRLVQTIINRFTSKEQMEISISKIKSVALLRILARSDKENCLEFIKTGIFQKMIWQLYRYTSFDQWVKSGKEACKLSSALLVEQLRLWKVCVQHGYCVSYFADLFPALCIWLNVPAFEKLIENSVLSEYAAIAKEAYLVLGALTRRLPIFYSHMQQLDRGTTEEAENWCWAHVGPMIDSALEWIRLKKIPLLSRLFEWQNEEELNGDIQDSAVSPLLWLISSIMDMLSAVLEAVIPEDNAELRHGSLPWLPDFVPKIGLEILKNGLMSFSGLVSASHDSSAGSGSFLECLCYLRKINGRETSIASSSCLQGLLRVAWCVDKLISLANNEPRDLFAKYQSFTREEETLADGILHCSLPELRTLMTSLVESNGSKWHHMNSIETFGRGGPAPGIGVGWGAPGGGFWSKHILSAQVDARLFIYLLDVFPIVSVKDQFTTEGMNTIIQKINSVMGACLLLGPMDSSAVDKLLDFLFQVPTLKYIDFSIRQFLTLKQGYQSLERVYEEEDYLMLSDVLASHFKKRWLSAKQKRKSAAGDEHVCRKNPKKGNILLDTIPEEISASIPASQEPKCLVAEWAHQRLHLPLHWFLSPLSVLCSTSHETLDFLKVAKGGLFFLLGIELMSTSLPAELRTPVRNVPIVWKLHTLSATLLSGMDIFEEENSRDLYKALQDVYGQLLDREEKVDAMKLKFKTDIHENYSTFIDNLVEQFAAVSYGDMIFGRQVGVYLHHFVEAPVRLAAWNALSNACALELLPPLEKCIAATCGYLEPVEDDERMLEAYCKSWVSGALDKAASRGSASFTLALHHLSSFVFQTCSRNMLPLRNKLAKSLLRDYSRKKQHESLFVNLLEYQRPGTISEMPQHSCNVENRLQILKEACEGNSSLLSEVEKLSSVIRRKQHVGS
uniref:Transcriptional elongation regulator MINIYO n=1 Tax=Nicotiana tabacum TaxID=4097 RepID=A0A1S3ZY17_TOBAC|nr:PREDICTED: transcriptional elongation regulator MINIYO [Nicotiana tabacum]